MEQKHTFEDFLSRRIGIRCDTKDEYDRLMQECEAKGLTWMHGDKPTQAPAERFFVSGASYTLGDPQRLGRLAHCFPPCNCGRDATCGHRNSVPFSAIFSLDPWADFLAGKCYLRVTKDEWPEFAKRCDEAGIEWHSKDFIANFTPPFAPFRHVYVAHNAPDLPGLIWNGENDNHHKTCGLTICDFSAIARPEPPKPAEPYDGRGKHKAGDRFVVVPSDHAHPHMRVGDVVELVVDDQTACPWFRTVGESDKWPVYWKSLKPVAPASDHKIIITTDGRVTTARLIEGKNVLKEGKATCAPDDKFDFMEGATLAYNRMRFGPGFDRITFRDVRKWSNDLMQLAQSIHDKLP